MFFDSHVHFDGVRMEGGGVAAAERAIASGVTRMLAVGGAPGENAAAVAMAERFPANVAASVGYDRDAAGRGWPEAALERLLVRPSGVVAVGETGLDFHYHPDTADAQIELFGRMLRLARAHARPVIVHSREADGATLDALRTHCGAWPGPADGVGVLHCFTGGKAFAGALLDLGFCISFSGIVTFRNAADLRETARHVPADRLLIETDTPYLAPVPLRGKPNEPAYVKHVAAALAEVRGCSVEALAGLTTRNAERLFNFPPTGGAPAAAADGSGPARR